MTPDEMKRILCSYNGIQREINGLNREIAHITGMKYAHISAPTSSITGMPHSGRVSDPTYDAVQRLMGTYDQKIQDASDEIVRLYADKEVIDTMMRWLRVNDQLEYDIIRLRYIELNTWRQICKKVHLCRDQAFERHKEGMQKLLNYWVK